MPILCKNPRYRYSKNVRLTFCNGKVIEAKSKRIVDLERYHKHKIHAGSRGGYYYISKGKKVYV